MARPPFKPTAKHKRQVAIAAGAGMVHEDIAAALGITKPTLRKHFKTELRGGAAMKRIELYVSLHTAGRGGSASAARAYLANVPHDSSEAAARPAGTPEGKKAAANEAAKSAPSGTDWDGLLPANVVKMRK